MTLTTTYPQTTATLWKPIKNIILIQKKHQRTTGAALYKTNALLFQGLDLTLTDLLEKALSIKTKYPTTCFIEITITDFPKSKVTIHILFYFSYLRVIANNKLLYVSTGYKDILILTCPVQQGAQCSPSKHYSLLHLATFFSLRPFIPQLTYLCM